MTFFVNGAQVAQIATNLPTAAIQPYAQIVVTGATARTIDLDYFGLVLPGLAR